MNLTIPQWIEHVETSISRALKHDSYIDAEIMDIRGFSTPIMQRLWSNLCHAPIKDLSYIEVGLFGGRSFCAAINNNPNIHAVGIENFSQDFGDPGIKEHLLQNIEKYRDHAASCTLIDCDFNELDTHFIPRNAHIGFYDGEHGQANQAAALPKLFPVMEDLFLWLVDDYSWIEPALGTEDGFVALKDQARIVWQKVLRPIERPQDCGIWHNGVGIFLVEKL